MTGFALRVFWQGIAKYADFKIYEDEGLNSTDVDASLQQLKDNDAKLKELNLNNIKVDSWDGLPESFSVNACIACVLQMQGLRRLVVALPVMYFVVH